MNEIKLHFTAYGDFPETSGEMRAERHCVLAYTKSLGWTQAIRRCVGKRKFEWVCSDYDGNTLFWDDEIIAWTELPEPRENCSIKPPVGETECCNAEQDNPNVFQLFCKKELPEDIQRRVERTAEYSESNAEYFFRAGFFLARELAEKNNQDGGKR